MRIAQVKTKEMVMAMTDASRLPGWSDALAPIAGWPEEAEQAHRDNIAVRLWDGFQDWRARRATVRALQALDGGTLRDLGINPREIESLVYGDGDDRIRGYDADWWRHRDNG
jgi:uncharacterized protein YjiS (DUF1127 family)